MCIRDRMQTISTPNLGDINGLVIPSGLTVIVGESYDGRIDLIDSISQGIYNHIPGDGREHCVTVSDAVEINTEPGRTVQNVDISHFFKNDDSYKCFTSDSANAYESQAASLVESLEAGSRVLFFDEENSSSSFLSSDSRLSNLQQGSSLFPLSAIARSLVDQLGISIIVSGSSLIAEFIPVADKIYKIKNSKVTDITNEAKELEIDSIVDNTHEDLSSILSKSRWIMPSSIDPSDKYDDVSVDIDNNGHLTPNADKVNIVALRPAAANPAAAIAPPNFLIGFGSFAISVNNSLSMSASGFKKLVKAAPI